MKISQIIEMARENGITLVEDDVRDFFKSHDNYPTIEEILIFCGVVTKC